MTLGRRSKLSLYFLPENVSLHSSNSLIYVILFFTARANYLWDEESLESISTFSSSGSSERSSNVEAVDDICTGVQEIISKLHFFFFYIHAYCYFGLPM